MDPATKRAINEEAVHRYFASWDPTWRWILILGLRDMRANLDRLGRLAAKEMGNESWAEEEYVYGPLALGITGAAVNEAAQHCEDLFALLSFLRDPTSFARRMGSYAAGRVVALAPKLKENTDEEVAARFCVPSLQAIEAGMTKADDPAAAVDVARDGVAHLAELVREVVDFYDTYEFFHVQYKHGLKLPLRPFGGAPSSVTIAQRKKDVRAPLFALSNEAVSEMVQRPPSQRAMMIPMSPESQKHLSELVQNRDLLRIQMAGPEVDLTEVSEISWTVSRLLRIAAENRLALGEVDEDGQQTFQLPGRDDKSQQIAVRIEPQQAIQLRNVS